MTTPCTKEAEIARIDERTLNMEKHIDEIHKAVIGANGEGLKGKMRSATVQLKIQWGIFVVIFGLIAWVLKS